jgi:hypothetical protein
VGNRPHRRYALAFQKGAKAMREAGLYRAILSLIPPWTRADLVLHVRGQQVTVRVDAGDARCRAPSATHQFPGTT